MIHLRPPLAKEDLQDLRVGDEVAFSGIIYTARDAAHQRMMQQLANGEELQFPVQGSVLY